VNRLVLAAIVVVGVPLVLMGYVTLMEGALRLLPGRRERAVRPWLWLLPAFFFLCTFLLYPAIKTTILSFYGPDSTQPVGLANYAFIFTNQAMQIALRNNGLWLLLFTSATVALGLLIAVLVDRVKYESVAKSVVFLPMAISFAAASVIWKFMYDYRPPGTPQTGTLNAVMTALIPGFQPQAWLINAPLNNVFIIIAAVWVWTGFCMVVLSAALKAISGEMLEAARVDGANEWQVFWRVTFPLLGPTVAVVVTIMVVFALKTFDVVYVMTSGNYDTQIIAFSQYQEMFRNHDFGRASTIGVILLLAILPVLGFNMQRFRQQEAER
jgi:alpha-glucoside transport system permease protein